MKCKPRFGGAELDGDSSLESYRGRATDNIYALSGRCKSDLLAMAVLMPLAVKNLIEPLLQMWLPPRLPPQMPPIGAKLGSTARSPGHWEGAGETCPQQVSLDKAVEPQPVFVEGLWGTSGR